MFCSLFLSTARGELDAVRYTMGCIYPAFLVVLEQEIAWCKKTLKSRFKGIKQKTAQVSILSQSLTL